MKRALFNLLTDLSLLLCVGTAFLWGYSAHSYERYYQASWSRESQQDICTSINLIGDRGRIYVGHERDAFSTAKSASLIRTATMDGFHHYSLDVSGPWLGSFDPLGVNNKRWLLGTESVNGKVISTRGVRLLAPAWALTFLTAVLPTFWFFRKRKSLRQKRLGLCPACGYDLRATPNRCPECGAVPRKL